MCPGKRSIGGKSNHGSILRQLCRYCLKGTCTRSPCEYWHPPECQFFKTYATSSKYPGKERTIAWKNTRQSSSSAKSLRKSPTKMVTANGEVQTREEATVSVKELDPFVTVMLLEETPAVLSLGKLCEDHGYACHCISGQKPHLIKNGLQQIKLCVIRSALVYQRVLPRRPQLLPHLHQRILYLTSADTPKIHYPKEVEVRVRNYGETRCINQQKTNTKIKMKDAKKYKAIYYVTCRTGCMSSERIWSMNVVLWSHVETLSLDIETLAVLLVNNQWSREQKWNRVRVSMVSTRIFRKTQIAMSAWRRKITRSSCRRRAGTVVSRAENFGDLITAYHRTFSEEKWFA